MRNATVLYRNTISGAVLALAAWVLASPALAGEVSPEREIDLKGTTNTRDIGGYRTDDLRTVRWGQIIRSENLSRLTADDFRKLEEIGVKTVIDLRTASEHEKKPTTWLGDHPPRFYHFPVGDADNDWFRAQRQMIKRNRFDEETSHGLMVDGYRMIAAEGVSSYQQVMGVVQDPANWPILIHCNAGKDRAGVATALILEAVGVEREVIMDDYLLTNEIGRSQEKAALMARESSKHRRVGRSPDAAAWYPVVGVEAEMLETFYASVDEQYGSMDRFLEELGVDQAAREALAAALTDEPQDLAMEQPTP